MERYYFVQWIQYLKKEQLTCKCLAYLKLMEHFVVQNDKCQMAEPNNLNFQYIILIIKFALIYYWNMWTITRNKVQMLSGIFIFNFQIVLSLVKFVTFLTTWDMKRPTRNLEMFNFSLQKKVVAFSIATVWSGRDSLGTWLIYDENGKSWFVDFCTYPTRISAAGVINETLTIMRVIITWRRSILERFMICRECERFLSLSCSSNT